MHNIFESQTSVLFLFLIAIRLYKNWSARNLLLHLNFTQYKMFLTNSICKIFKNATTLNYNFHIYQYVLTIFQLCYVNLTLKGLVYCCMKKLNTDEFNIVQFVFFLN